MTLQNDTATTPIPPTPRDEQRAALSELIRLAADCVKLDARIEKDLADAKDVAARKLKQRIATITAESVEVIGRLQGTRLVGTEAANNAIQSSRLRLKKAIDDRVSRIEGEYDSLANKIKQDRQDAQWLAESVMDSAIIAADTELKETSSQAETDRVSIDELRNTGLATIHRFGLQQTAIEFAAEPETGVPSAEFESVKAALAADVDRLAQLPLPRLFVGAVPFIAALLVVGLAAAATQPWKAETAADWRITGIVTGVALAIVIVAGFLLMRLSEKQVRSSWARITVRLNRAYGAIESRIADAKALRERRVAEAKAGRDAEMRRIAERFDPMLARAKARRDENLEMARSNYARELELAESKFAEESIRIHSEHETGIAAAEKARDDAIAAAKRDHDDEVAAAVRAYDAARAELEQRWADGQLRTKRQNETDPGGGVIRIGTLNIDLAKIAAEAGALQTMRLVPPQPYDTPAWLAMPRQASMLIEHDPSGRAAAIDLLRASVFAIMSTLPAGRAKFTFIDPVGLGQSFAGFMHLADYDDSLVGGRIWSEQEQIEQRLADLTAHMETVIQKYLRNEFATIDDYNRQAGELAEPYRFLVIADLPTSFSDEALRRLANIATTGARCGVYVLATRDARQPFGDATVLEDLRSSCSVFAQNGGAFLWRDEVFGRFAFRPAKMPDDATLTAKLHAIGRAAKESKRIEVAFEAIAPAEANRWSLDASSELAVNVGRTGATRLQSFRLGRGVAQHALVAGKTGSGKSTLLNVLVTNVALWYSPDEVELYLIDFKRGVEFKPYTTHRLPHARAIAVESDREFGLSVLQRLDAELNRRGELFRRAGVQDLPSFRKAQPGATLPRQLLIVDEFQELFTEDDKLSQEAALLIDRLVRQGRAFGIHVVLGSQTIGGTTGLPRTTYGQMAVRVALQCTEADSQMILGDNNSAARLLSRPGEAIYNDAGGAVENNSPFQVSWLPDSLREKLLESVSALAKSRGYRSPGVAIFEGNAPAHIEDNIELANQLETHPTIDSTPAVVRAYVGEAVAIKPPTAVVLGDRAGANVLAVGQAEEHALSVQASMCISIAAQSPAGKLRIVLLDATPADSSLAGRLGALLRKTPAFVEEIAYREAGAAVSKLADELAARREESSSRHDRILLVINGLQRYRDLRRQEESFSFSMEESDTPKAVAPDKALAELLREGAGLGIHVLAWIDTVAALERTIERGLMREFDHRVLFQMSAADSSYLIDTPAANKLGSFRAIYFSEELGVIEKFRPYAIPTEDFLARFNAGATV